MLQRRDSVALIWVTFLQRLLDKLGYFLLMLITKKWRSVSIIDRLVLTMIP